MPTIRSPRASASFRASSGICRRAPGVPWSHTIGWPSGVPNSAMPSLRPARTRTVPSSRGAVIPMRRENVVGGPPVLKGCSRWSIGSRTTSSGSSTRTPRSSASPTTARPSSDAPTWRWPRAAGSARSCGVRPLPSSCSCTAAPRTRTRGTPWRWRWDGRSWPSTCPATATPTPPRRAASACGATPPTSPRWSASWRPRPRPSSGCRSAGSRPSPWPTSTPSWCAASCSSTSRPRSRVRAPPPSSRSSTGPRASPTSTSCSPAPSSSTPPARCRRFAAASSTTRCSARTAAGSGATAASPTRPHGDADPPGRSSGRSPPRTSGTRSGGSTGPAHARRAACGSGSVVDDEAEAELLRRLPQPPRVEHVAEAGHSVPGRRPAHSVIGWRGRACCVADFVPP